jgi:hypothetical protein
VTVPEKCYSLYVRVDNTVDRALLAPSATVLLPAEPFLLADEDRPGVTYDDVAGCARSGRPSSCR